MSTPESNAAEFGEDSKREILALYQEFRKDLKAASGFDPVNDITLKYIFSKIFNGISVIILKETISKLEADK